MLSRSLLVGVSLLAMASTSYAADLIIDVPATEPVAVADTGWYLSVFAGGVWDAFVTAEDDTVDVDTDDVEIDTELGWLLGAAVGTKLFDNVRGEIELSGASRDLTGATEGDAEFDVTGSVTTAYLLGNLWFDFDNGSGFTPYVGGGLGLGYIHAEADTTEGVAALDADGYGFAYQLGAGVKFDVASNVALDLGYRFKGIAGAEISGEGTEDVAADVGSHVVQVGLTFGF